MFSGIGSRLRRKLSAFRRSGQPYPDLKFGNLCMDKLLREYEFNTVLDIGAGERLHSKCFEEAGKEVVALDLGKSHYFRKADSAINFLNADYLQHKFDKKFDVIWACHVLEHQVNPNIFLRKILDDLKEGGIFAVTVPPLKHQIVGGHVTLWNEGMLLYHLVLAGFNCKAVSVLRYGYNISAILRKEAISDYPDLCFDKGDIRALSRFLPDQCREPFDGRIGRLNWDRP